MLAADLFVDLPSEPVPPHETRWQRFRQMLGGRLPQETGLEQLTSGMASAVEHLLHALVDSDWTDLLVLWLDGQAIYVDRNRFTEELEDALHVPLSEGLLGDVHEVRFALDHNDRDLHSVVEIVLRSPVRAGTEELQVHLVGRIPQLQVRRGETAQDYHERLEVFAASKANIAPYVDLFGHLAEGLAQALQRTLGPVRVKGPWLELRRPDALALVRLNNLGFGDSVSVPEYHAPRSDNPPRRAFEDPYSMFYPDPYQPLRHWILIDEMIRHHAWALPWVRIMSSMGELLMTGDEIPEASGRLAWRHRALTYDVDGTLQVDASD